MRCRVLQEEQREIKREARGAEGAAERRGKPEPETRSGNLSPNRNFGWKPRDTCFPPRGTAARWGQGPSTSGELARHVIHDVGWYVSNVCDRLRSDAGGRECLCREPHVVAVVACGRQIVGRCCYPATTNELGHGEREEGRERERGVLWCYAAWW